MYFKYKNSLFERGSYFCGGSLMRILLNLFNYILCFLGLRIVKFSKFDRFVERLIKQAKPVKFINIGTSDGVRFDSLYFTDTGQRWSGSVIAHF